MSCDLRANERPKKTASDGANTQTDEHRDSKTESDQWANSVERSWGLVYNAFYFLNPTALLPCQISIEHYQIILFPTVAASPACPV